MNSKLLILESNWADDDDDYLIESRSTAKIYSSIETLISLQNTPLQIIHRPLLANRFVKDIELFTSLEENQKGINIIILSAHGNFYQKQKNNKKKNCRQLFAYDGELNISTEIRKVSHLLSRTILILDSCSVGTNIKSLLKASNALGIIGFSKEVDWVDSAVFIFALLSKYQDEEVFSLMRKSPIRPKQILEKMKESHYRLFFEELGIEYSFA